MKFYCSLLYSLYVSKPSPIYCVGHGLTFSFDDDVDDGDLDEPLDEHINTQEVGLAWVRHKFVIKCSMT